MTNINPYTFLNKISKNELTLGLMAFEFMTPGLPSIVSASGADFLIYDTEHSGCGIETIKQQVAYARGLDLYPIARLPGIHKYLISTFLDAGIKGIMLPSVSSEKQARDIVKWCRYRPEGNRGLGFNVAHDNYTAGDPLNKMKIANSENMIIVLIETVEGLNEIDKIMSIPEIDIGWLGHYDLTDSMSITGKFDHPTFLKGVDKFLNACLKNGKKAGILDLNIDMLIKFKKIGFSILGYGHDVMVFQKSLNSGFSLLRDN